MAMSRKHYREAAEIIRLELPNVDDATVLATERRETLKSVADGLADMFKRDNSAFRREQFMEACGL